MVSCFQGHVIFPHTVWQTNVVKLPDIFRCSAKADAHVAGHKRIKSHPSSFNLSFFLSQIFHAGYCYVKFKYKIKEKSLNVSGVVEILFF